MKTVTTTMTILTADSEIEINLFGEYSPAEKGSRGYYGEAMEPDYSSTVDFWKAEDDFGNEIELTEEQIDQAQKALENVLDDFEAGMYASYNEDY